MEGEQKWYQSRSVLTGIVSVVAMILTVLGVNLGAEDQETIIQAVLGGGGIIAGLASIWFRVTAKKKIVS